MHAIMLLQDRGCAREIALPSSPLVVAWKLWQTGQMAVGLSRRGFLFFKGVLMKRSLLAGLALAWLTGLGGPVSATHPLPGPHVFQCEARGDDVVLAWDELGISAELHDATVYRDDAPVGTLEPLQATLRDEGVPMGLHQYRLEIVLRSTGDILAREECEVEVLLESGIECAVFGGIAVAPQVAISWSPLPADLRVSSIVVERDSELVASLSPDQTHYQEEPLHGEHLYRVVGVVGGAPDQDTTDSFVIGDCLAVYNPPRIGGFVRGDTNADGDINLSDAIFILLYLFQGGETPSCLSSLDSNDSGNVDLSDAIHSLSFSFLGGAQPPEPFPLCGDDPTPDGLDCQAFAPCFNPPPP